MRSKFTKLSVSLALCVLLGTTLLPISTFASNVEDTNLRVTSDWCPNVLTKGFWDKIQASCYSVENQKAWSKTVIYASKFLPIVGQYVGFVESAAQEDFGNAAFEAVTGSVGELGELFADWKRGLQVEKTVFSKVGPEASDFKELAVRQKEIEASISAINIYSLMESAHKVGDAYISSSEYLKGMGDLTEQSEGNLILGMLNKAFSNGYLDPKPYGSYGLWSVHYKRGLLLPTKQQPSVKLIENVITDFHLFLSQGDTYTSKYDAQAFLMLSTTNQSFTYADYKNYEKVMQQLNLINKKHQQQGVDLIALADKLVGKASTHDEALEIYSSVANNSSLYGKKNVSTASSKLAAANKTTAPSTTTNPNTKTNTNTTPKPATTETPSTASLNASSKPVLVQGRDNSSDWVKLLQSTLSKKMYFFGTVDGDFGPITSAAVKRIQRDNGLEPDGIVGSMSWEVLAKTDPYPRIRVQVNGSDMGSGFKIGNDTYLPKTALDALNMPASQAPATKVNGVDYYMWANVPLALNPVSIGNVGYNFKTTYPTVRVTVNGKDFKSAFMVDGSAYLDSSILDLMSIKYTGTDKITLKDRTYIRWNSLPLNYTNLPGGGFNFTRK